MRQYARKIRNKIINTIFIHSETYVVLSFPKSGRTWLELMHAKIYEQLCGENINDILNGKKKVLISKKGYRLPYISFGHGHKNGQWCQKDYTSLFEKYSNKRTVILTRDPRDVVVSHYHHEHFRDQNFSGTLSEFISFDNLRVPSDSRRARLGIKAIINYLNGCADFIKNKEDAYILSYENLKEDTHKEVENLYDFFGVDVPEEILNEAIQYASFDNMKWLEENEVLDWHGLERNNGSEAKVRKGKVGNYDKEVTKEQYKTIEQNINDHLKNFWKLYKKK